MPSKGVAEKGTALAATSGWPPKSRPSIALNDSLDASCETPTDCSPLTPPTKREFLQFSSPLTPRAPHPGPQPNRHWRTLDRRAPNTEDHCALLDGSNESNLDRNTGSLDGRTQWNGGFRPVWCSRHERRFTWDSPVSVPNESTETPNGGASGLSDLPGRRNTTASVVTRPVDPVPGGEPSSPLRHCSFDRCRWHGLVERVRLPKFHWHLRLGAQRISDAELVLIEITSAGAGSAESHRIPLNTSMPSPVRPSGPENHRFAGSPGRRPEKTDRSAR